MYAITSSTLSCLHKGTIASFMSVNDVIDDTEEVVLPTVYAAETSKEPKQEKRQHIMPTLQKSTWNTCIVDKRHLQLNYKYLSVIMTKMILDAHPAHRWGSSKALFTSILTVLLYRLHYRRSEGPWGQNVCTAVCEERTTVPT